MPTSNNLILRDAMERIQAICDESQGRSQFFPFGGSGYKACVVHHFSSSTEISACAVQPGSVEDLQSIVKVIAETRAPFAVKCGGHSTNPGFSSTEGIQIHLARLNKIMVDEEKKLVHVGAGCLFGELYRALAPYNLNVVGGSGLSDVGVTGWVLGGGYSSKTSRYGLGIDNIAGAKIVLANGELKKVTAEQEKDLFFAIKGGGNNFGIITELTLKAHEQGRYYDFLLTFQPNRYSAAEAAIANFVKKADPKANIEAAFKHEKNDDGIERSLTVHCVYDGDFPTADPFGELRVLEHTLENYGDPLPMLAVSYGPPDSSATSTEPSCFHLADTLYSLHNGTYDLADLPKDVAERDTEEAKYKILMSGQTLAITEFVGDGSLKKKPPARKTKRPAAGSSPLSRARWGNVMVDAFTPGIVHAVEQRSLEASNEMTTHGGTRVVVRLWPFTASMFDDATPSAWPHVRGAPNCPITVSVEWQDEANDGYWIDTIKTTLGRLRDAVHAERPSSKGLPYAVGTALAEGTSASDVYRGHLDELKQLRLKYDPDRVMDLTGGFRIPHPVAGQ